MHTSIAQRVVCWLQNESSRSHAHLATLAQRREPGGRTWAEDDRRPSIAWQCPFAGSNLRSLSPGIAAAAPRTTSSPARRVPRLSRRRRLHPAHRAQRSRGCPHIWRRRQGCMWTTVLRYLCCFSEYTQLGLASTICAPDPQRAQKRARLERTDERNPV